MIQGKEFFFCGVGGSGMAPLATIVMARGGTVAGSDRAYDQGRTPAKFDYLQRRGVTLRPQDGSGLTHAGQTLVVSAAVEETIPDVQAARRLGVPIVTRAELLAELFNAADLRIGVGGTSGKSTITGMIGWILSAAGKAPTVMNGADMKNFMTADAPFASALTGEGRAFVSEIDESDGSIALYRPRIAVVSNVSLDHKSMAELRALFGGFVACAGKAVLNLDNPETAALAASVGDKAVTYALDNEADLVGRDLAPAPDGIGFEVIERSGGERAQVRLCTPGRHNASNALAAIAAARAAGIDLATAAAALGEFRGIRRRMDVIGTANDITVIDDFGHNPDKIAATLDTLHAFSGRLLVMFQPHGFGPLRLMRQAFIDTFVEKLGPQDVLLMPEPVYFGGTVDRSVGSTAITEGVAAAGRQAEAHADRATCGERLLALASAGDRIVVMGARDDTLPVFASEMLQRLHGR